MRDNNKLALKGKYVMYMKTIGFLIIVISSSAIADNNYIINSDHRLYRPQSDNIRAIIEPGTLLIKLDVPIQDRYRKRARVITPGGLLGEIRKGGYVNISKISESIAYLKRTLDIGGRKYNEDFNYSDIFKAKRIEGDEEDIYKITYPIPYYSLPNKSYFVRTKEKEFKESDFNYRFNFFDPENPQHKFPYWSEKKKDTTEWGCGKSKEERKVFKLGAGAEVKASGGFFGFFEADGYVNNDNTKTVTYTSIHCCPVNFHSITN